MANKARSPIKPSASQEETSTVQALQRTAILSRTFSSSSTIKWILPARIRSTSKNDVVFVGETFVQLREFLDTGQLADATAKLEFGTQILAAKVISASLQVVPVLDAILKQERDQEQYSIGGQPLDESHPPQLLVLSTSDNELVYIYAREDFAGDARFVFAKRSLLRGVVLPGRECGHMAVDYDSRALAIASSSGYIAVFKLHTVDDVKTQIDHWDPLRHDSFKPWSEQRFIQIDGCILKMEFLRTSDPDNTKVLLLLLVDSGAETRQVLYTWDTRSPLKTMKSMMSSGRPLKEDRCPLMLIPSTRPYSFVLVMESGISYYENVHTLEYKRINCRFMKNTAGPLVWVHWAKPKRHNEYLERRDDLVIVREDGLLQYFQIEKSSSTKFNMNNTVGHLGIHVDTAFCMMAGPPGKGGDIIIAGGDMTDGGVFHVSARGAPEKTQTIPNLAPVYDMIIGGPDDEKVNEDGGILKKADQLYICGGNEEGRGEISEIRYGIEAQLGWTMPYPDAFDIHHIWTLEMFTRSSLLLVASQTDCTTAVTFDLETQDIEFADADSLPGFDFSNPTLAAAVIKIDKIVQVTTNGIHVIPLAGHTSYSNCIHKAADCLHADIFEEDGIIAFVRRTPDGYEVTIAAVITTEGGGVGVKSTSTPIFLPEQPISLCCMTADSKRILIVGTNTAKLLGYRIMPDMKLTPTFDHKVNDLASTVDNAPIASLAAISHAEAGPTLLLCGLRHGILLCLELRIDSDANMTVRCDDYFRLGSTTVQISKEKALTRGIDSRSALVLCDGQLRRIVYHQNTTAVDFTMSALYLTNTTDPAAPQAEINAVHRIPKLISPFGELGGLMVCATGEELLFASLVAQEQTIAAHLQVEGIPRRALYSKFLKKLVIAVERKKKRQVPRLLIPGAEEHTSKSETIIDTHRPSESEDVSSISLQIVEPHLQTQHHQDFVSVAEDSNLRVTALLEWEIKEDKEGKENTRWIVLGLSQHEQNAHTGSGRVIAIRSGDIKKGNTTSPHTRVLHRSLQGPVHTLCIYGRSSLLIAAANEIILLNLDLSNRKLKILSRYDLPSSAQGISTQEPLIFVATSRHSLIVLLEQNDELIEHNLDSIPRTLNNVVTFARNCAMFSILDEKGTHLMAVSNFGPDAGKPVPMFRASLPLLIDRIRVRNNSTSDQEERYQFYGSTTDGTLYHFSTLKYHEWRLLHFLEELSHFERKTIKAIPMRKKAADGSEIVFQPPTMKLSDMHVRGDRLLMMVEPGPYNLRQLLRTPEEREDLKILAKEVVGVTEHTIEAVVIWIRKLLTYPPRG